MQVTRVFDLMPFLKMFYPNKELFSRKVNGIWEGYSTENFCSAVDDLSLGLLKMNIQKDDKIANMASNRPEWNIIDFAVMQVGAVHVPMYPTLSEADILYILKDSSARILFVENKMIYDKVLQIKAQLPNLEFIYAYDEIEGIESWKQLCQLADHDDLSKIEAYREKVQPDDLLTLIYTSGTTGNPKGVMLSHDNLVSNFKGSNPLIPKEAKVALSFLPLSHIFERMVVYMYLSRGVSIYYAESMEKIADNLKEIKPHMFTTVPRLLEKVYDKIVAKGTEQKGIKKALFFWALNLGLKYEYNRANGYWYELQLWLANKIIFNKWRAALGGNILAAASGGAALQERLARVFWAAGIPVLQGYGLTETSPVVCVNGIEKGMHYFGTAGPAIPGVEVKIAEDGEILVKGPNVMKGYYNRKEATEEAIDVDNWFHTGDIGTLIDGKHLKITDRKKEIFKTAGGKYIAPGAMENKFKESKFIEQIVVIGENERFPAALIVPNFIYLKDWCTIKGIPYSSNQEMISDKRIIARIFEEVKFYNEGYGQWEQLKKFELLPREFTIEEGEMTPKLSLKRKVIIEKNKYLLDQIYDYNKN